MAELSPPVFSSQQNSPPLLPGGRLQSYDPPYPRTRPHRFPGGHRPSPAVTVSCANPRPHLRPSRPPSLLRTVTITHHAGARPRPATVSCANPRPQPPPLLSGQPPSVAYPSSPPAPSFPGGRDRQLCESRRHPNRSSRPATVSCANPPPHLWSCRPGAATVSCANPKPRPQPPHSSGAATVSCANPPPRARRPGRPSPHRICRTAVANLLLRGTKE
jgi:hypothetical protein